jgi:uncharacterized membrane protein (UPF0127 family)
VNKLSWPYIGNPENEMGSMKNNGNYRDFMEDSYERLDSLNPEKYTSTGNELPTATISGGVIFKPQEDKLEENMFFDFLFNDDGLTDNSNILVVSDDVDEVETYASPKYNIFCLTKTADLFSEKIVTTAGDSKYFKFNKKFDLFYIKEDNFDNLKLSLFNLKDQLKNISYGYINTKLDNNSLKKAASFANIDYDKIKNISNNFYRISFNNLKNSKIIGVLDRNGDTKAAFICDVADSFESKKSGLQAYSSINNSFGLLFPYKKATDVSYHMGSVSYPIDIIFLDDNSIIKKIERNIQPGSPGLFCCSGVKNVLEIKGGMSGLLDINTGDSIFIDSADYIAPNSIEKDTAIKTSKILSSAVHKYGNVSIRIKGNKEINKSASLISVKKDICIVDLDAFLNYNVKIHKLSNYNYSNVRNIICSSPKTIDNKFKNESVIKYASDSIDSEYCLPATFTSFNEAFRSNIKTSLSEILGFKGKVVLATTNNLNWEKIASILNFKSKILFNKNFPFFETLLYDKDDSLYHAAKNRYANNDLYFLNKKAGFPIPKEDVEKAKKAEELFKKTNKDSEKLLDNLKKNLSVYQNIQADKERIKNSKHEYNESVKRNTELLKKILIDIKQALKIMNEIKDISNTIEIISAVASATMRSSEIVKDIFDLVNYIEADDFIQRLTEKTSEAEKMFLDLDNSNQRMINYINTDILGVLIITQ